MYIFWESVLGVSWFFSILPAEETVFWARINIARGFFLGWCGGFCGFMLGFFFLSFSRRLFPIALGSSVAQIFGCYHDKNMVTIWKLDMIYEVLVCLNSQSLLYQFAKVIYKYFRNNAVFCMWSRSEGEYKKDSSISTLRAPFGTVFLIKTSHSFRPLLWNKHNFLN